MITTQYMTSFTPEEMQRLVEQGNAKDARIAELEAWKQSAIHQLGEWDKVFELAGKPGNLGESKAEIMQRWVAAAQERERDFAEWVWQAVYHEQREAGEFRDDAKVEADRVVAGIRGEVSALAAAQREGK